ncbi:uncharacterized protein LOC115484547 [Serinus canaria]|uniref:uncharacterized protein LOC115484547 n=1 Tax=Serinus canaria TaxID=9135 RepID=UPI0021CC8847|nr:uncharacterized protein LOC115484547 [Serinus canaria]
MYISVFAFRSTPRTPFLVPIQPPSWDHLALGDDEPMARKEPLLSALKGERGPPGTCASFSWPCLEGCCGCGRAGAPARDTSPHFVSLCQLLESVLRKGLRRGITGTGWSSSPRGPAAAGADGAGPRAVLSLQGKVLAVAVRQLAQTPRLLEFYDPGSSILGSEDLREPFLSLLLVLTEIDFSLDLQNYTFLDESWLLPEVLFDVKEAEILVQERVSSKLLCRHPYPSISWVGHCTWSPRIFAFCVLFSPESPDGSMFDCLVFASSSEQECEQIIGRIGKGRVFKASTTISHTRNTRNSVPVWNRILLHGGSDFIPFVEVTKMKRYFSGVGFFFLRTTRQ